MSTTSLLAWRATCRDSYLVVTKRPRDLLSALIARFFIHPHRFIRDLTRWGVLLVGEAALSIILNDPSISDKTLELAVGNASFERFVWHLSKVLPLGTHVVNHIDKPSPPSFPYLRNITRIAEFYLTTGLVVHVYESSSASACDVICGAWTTALMNFVTVSSFGCAYPRLTLNFHGLLCDGRIEGRRWLDHITHDRLHKKGFLFRRYTSPQSNFLASPYAPSPPNPVGCGKTIYVCPFQARYFGDSGSLVVFFDGFFIDLDELRDLSVAPYGPMTAWRIPTDGTCDGHCIED